MATFWRSILVSAVTLLLILYAVGCSNKPEAPIEAPAILIGGVEGLAERIVYPESAKRDGIEGQVVVRFIIDTTGVPGRFEVIESLCDECDQAVIDAISQSRFIPGTQRGVPVFVRHTLPVTFRFNDN